MSKKHPVLLRNLALVATVIAVQLVAGAIFWQWGARFTDSSATLTHKLVSYVCAAVILLAPLVGFSLRRRLATKDDISTRTTLFWPVLLLFLLLAWPIAGYTLVRNHFKTASSTPAVLGNGRVAAGDSKPKDDCINSAILLQRNDYKFADYAKVISKYGSAADKKYLNELPSTIDKLADQCHQKKLSVKEEKSQIKQLSQQFIARGKAVLADAPKDKLTAEEKALR